MGVTTCPSCGAPHPPYVPCAARSAPLPADSGLSFIERYRGTDWDNSPRVAEVPVTYARQHGGRSFLLIGGIVAIVAVAAAAIGGMMLLGSKPSSPMGAFLTSTPGPPVVRTARPVAPFSPPPAAGTQPGMPTPGATPTPTFVLPPIDPGLADTPAGAFLAMMMSGDARYQAEATGSAAYGNERVTIDFSAKVSGADQEAEWVIGQNRERALTHVIIKNGRYFTKPAGEPWRQLESGAGLPSDGFSSIAAESWLDLTYVGPVERAGRRLHHLSLPEIDWQSIPDAYYLDADEGGLILHDVGCDIWVSAAGEPVEAEIWFEATARDHGLEVDLSYEIAYEFSHVGEPVDIEAPRVTDDGGQVSG